MVLTLNVAEQVRANEGEEQHGDGQGAVGQHLPHFGMQEGTEREREGEEAVRHLMEEDETEAAAETRSCSRVRMWFRLGPIRGRLLTPPESDGTAASPSQRQLTVPAGF